MAHGAPDWTQQVVVVIVKGQPADEQAAGAVGRYSGTDTTYQEVAKWTIATSKVGELKHITVLSDTYTKTHFQITVGAVVYATDWIMLSSIPLVFEDLRLAAATEVTVEAKSTDGTAIVVDASIVGKEINE